MVWKLRIKNNYSSKKLYQYLQKNSVGLEYVNKVTPITYDSASVTIKSDAFINLIRKKIYEHTGAVTEV